MEQLIPFLNLLSFLGNPKVPSNWHRTQPHACELSAVRLLLCSPAFAVTALSLCARHAKCFQQHECALRPLSRSLSRAVYPTDLTSRLIPLASERLQIVRTHTSLPDEFALPFFFSRSEISLNPLDEAHQDVIRRGNISEAADLRTSISNRVLRQNKINFSAVEQGINSCSRASTNTPAVIIKSEDVLVCACACACAC